MLFSRAFERARGAFFRDGLRLRREGERGVVELTPLPLGSSGRRQSATPSSSNWGGIYGRAQTYDLGDRAFALSVPGG
jgi:hypothetical protein